MRLRRKLRRLWWRIELYFTGHWTLCGDCGYWSSGTYCNCTPSWRR